MMLAFQLRASPELPLIQLVVSQLLLVPILFMLQDSYTPVVLHLRHKQQHRYQQQHLHQNPQNQHTDMALGLKWCQTCIKDSGSRELNTGSQADPPCWPLGARGLWHLCWGGLAPRRTTSGVPTLPGFGAWPLGGLGAHGVAAAASPLCGAATRAGLRCWANLVGTSGAAGSHLSWSCIALHVPASPCPPHQTIADCLAGP